MPVTSRTDARHAHHLATLALSALLATIAAPSLAQAQHLTQPQPTPAAPRTITVVGQAELKVVPDEFVITFGVETSAKKANDARLANERQTASILSKIRARKIEGKYIKTEDFKLSPVYEGRYESRRLKGYDADRRVSVIVRDASILEPLLSEIFEAGANRLYSVTFHSSKIRAQLADVRLQAVKAARDKAAAMAGVLNQKLGAPLRIDEQHGATARTSNFAYLNTSAAAPATNTLATGKLRISAAVTITFELR